MHKLALVAVLAALPAVAAAADPLMGRAKALFEPLPRKAPPLGAERAVAEKVKLGRMLFFDPRLSASFLISCNSCHNMGLAGADLQETSIGHGWQKGPRNAPTVFNSFYNSAQFWDGRAKDLAEQAMGPVQAAVEMNNTPIRVVETLKSLPRYVAAFTAAFPGEKDPVTFANTAMAIRTFETTLITPDAPFDRFLRGDAKALGPRARQGLALFLDKGCAACHRGRNIGGTGYYPFGVVEKPGADVLPPEDTGRFKVTNTAADKYVFKAPSLRNVALTPPYFHSGKVWKLRAAVEIMGSAQLGIHLADQEADRLVDFLETLSGKQPLVEYPVLPPNSETTPRPLLGLKVP